MIISSDDVLPLGLFLTKGPSYGIGWNNGSYRWLFAWHPRHGWRFAHEQVPE